MFKNNSSGFYMSLFIEKTPKKTWANFMKNQVKSIIAQTTYLEKITAHAIRVHVETIPQNKKSFIKINLGRSALGFNVFHLAVLTHQ